MGAGKQKDEKKNPDIWWGVVDWGREDDGWVGLGLVMLQLQQNKKSKARMLNTRELECWAYSF